MRLQPGRTFAEFFAGIGLMRLGLERAGWKVAFANDIDEDKAEMYADHFGSAEELLVGDIHKLNARDLPAVGLATASFPCNDLSLAGARNGLAGAQSSAFWGFIAVLKGWKRLGLLPPLVLLENVTGFLTSNEGNDFRNALTALNDIGYGVDAFVIDAARFVPQSRQRLFVVGVKDAGMPRDQVLASDEKECRPPTLADFIMWNGDIKWNIRKLPPLPSSKRRLEEIVEDLPPNHKMWWSKERCEYLLNQMSPKHRAVAEEMIKSPALRYSTVFRRVRNGRSMAELRTDGIAGCLRTPRGGSGRQILVVTGNGNFRVRLLAPRECARLMGADDFVLKVPLHQALFGFGDAVCVPVIEWIAKNYLNRVWEELGVCDPCASATKRYFI